MSENQWPGSVVRDDVPGGPRDIVSLISRRCKFPPVGKRLKTSAVFCPGFEDCQVHFRSSERFPARIFKEMSGAPVLR